MRVFQWNTFKRGRKHSKRQRLAEHLTAQGAPILTVQEAVGWGAQHVPGYVMQGDSTGGVLLGVPAALAHGIRDVWSTTWAVIVVLGHAAYFSFHLKPGNVWSNDLLRERLGELSGAMAALDARHRPRVWIGGGDANSVAVADTPGVSGSAVYVRRRGSTEAADRARSRVWMRWLAAEGFALSNTGGNAGGALGEGRARWTWRPRVVRQPGEAQGVFRRRRANARLSAAQIDFILVRGPVTGSTLVRRGTPWTSDHRSCAFVGQLHHSARGSRSEADGTRRCLRGWALAGQGAVEEFDERCKSLVNSETVDDFFTELRQVAEAAPHTTQRDRRLDLTRAGPAEAQAKHLWRAERGAEKRAELKREWMRLRRERRRRAARAEVLRARMPGNLMAMTDEEGALTADRARWAQLQTDYVRELFRSRRDEVGDGGDTATRTLALLAEAPGARGMHGGSASLGREVWIGAMGRLGDSTSYGTDGVTAGMLRALPWEAKLRLADLLDEVTVEGLPGRWAESEMVAIGKDRVRAPGAHQLRYLGLGALSQKLFASGVLSGLPPAPLWHVGFAPGQSPHDVVGILRAGLFDASVWQDPALTCVVLSCDVQRAFDSIEHDVLASALLAQGVPPAIAELLMLPLVRGRTRVRGGSDFVETRRGTRTGGVDSPYNLNAVLAHATADLVRQWQREGRGWAGERGASLWWWADNAFIVARTVAEAFTLFGELTLALKRSGLRWKPSSLELCTGGDERGAVEGNRIGEAATTVDAEQYRFTEVTHLRVLGPVLPARARQREEVEQAVNAANGRWHARRALWRCRFLGQAAKLRHFYSDVCGALVDHAGGWHLAPRVLEQATTWERDRLRVLIGMRSRREGETAEEFWRAFDHRLNEVCRQTGTRRLAERIVTSYARRGVRMAVAAPGTAPFAALSAMHRNRPCEWRMHHELFAALDPHNAQRWRHRSAGRPPPVWEDLCACAGRRWVCAGARRAARPFPA